MVLKMDAEARKVKVGIHQVLYCTACNGTNTSHKRPRGMTGLKTYLRGLIEVP